MNILFICTGNTCRSPMAAALLKNKKPTVQVKSAGIFANKNSAPNRNAIRALQTYDIQLSHKSNQVTEDLLNWADLVLAMTTEHVQTLILQYPQFQEKYYTLKEYALGADNKVWKQLQEAYAHVEMKRSKLIHENQFKLDQLALEQLIYKECKDDLMKIEQLEGDMVDYNISDPFGGPLEVYEQTAKELHMYIHAVTKKIE